MSSSEYEDSASTYCTPSTSPGTGTWVNDLMRAVPCESSATMTSVGIALMVAMLRSKAAFASRRRMRADSSVAPSEGAPVFARFVDPMTCSSRSGASVRRTSILPPGQGSKERAGHAVNETNVSSSALLPGDGWVMSRPSVMPYSECSAALMMTVRATTSRLDGLARSTPGGTCVTRFTRATSDMCVSCACTCDGMAAISLAMPAARSS
mmetsp:Transcript_6249/g.20397  ORF Transcript_6249/g.20397 Transcript_6249/m.20397 type:complete len:209 (-) Transcript_6249:333-959(-)